MEYNTPETLSKQYNEKKEEYRERYKQYYQDNKERP